MIAVTFALPAESRDFVKRIGGVAARKRDRRIFIGSIDAVQIEVLHTGVGGGLAEKRLRAYLEQASPEFLVSSGFAGATTRDSSVGEIVLAPNYSDPVLLGRAEKALHPLKPRVGNLFTAVEMIDSTSARADVWHREQAVAIDMETATIAAVCRERGLPLLALRVVSDTPEEPFPLPAHVLFDQQRQRTVARRLVGHLVAHPGSTVRLVRFGRRIARVRRHLSEVLLTLLQNPA